MPILQFIGPEAEREVMLDLIRQIKVWVASVGSLEVGVENVTPIFVPSIQENPGECVVFYVQELFTVSFTGKTRTTAIRNALSRAIKKGFDAFVDSDRLAVRPKSVTVVMRMVDREKGEYHNWPIPPRK